MRIPRNNPVLLASALYLALAGTALAQQAPTSPQQRTAEEQKTMPPQDARWARLDNDADGRISAVEADQDSAFGVTFDDMDTDDDGFVSNAEFVAFGEATTTRSASQDKAEGTSAETTSTTGSTSGFAGLDKDKDGRVSSTEAGANTSFDSGFAAMDDNGDGFVTDAEFRAHSRATKQP